MNKLVLTALYEERIDKYTADNSDISRSYAAKLCDEGRARVNSKPVSKKYRLHISDVIEFDIPEPECTEVTAQDIPLDIVYEDEDLLVVNKPRGMVVHPAAGNESGTLVNALMYHCPQGLSAINGVIRPGIVHRIDKETSGLLLVAKNNEAHLALSAQLKERKALRKYWALVNGNIREDCFTVNKPIARHPSDRKKMAVVQGGREAITHVSVLKRYGGFTLVECRLETGRTHQIRVHLASVGHSIVGDKTYGIKKERFKLEGQLLHAKTIGFVHPRTGKLMEFDSELPEHFVQVLQKLEL
ncbi:MAG: RluA family pseudouridine synthase [Clostridiales bacterium]|nr:RluA family pseudouridine synthase [Clostridiales bacterium]